MSYQNLEIWQLARTLVVEVDQMTLKKLPKFEMFEEGSQMREVTTMRRPSGIQHPVSSIQSP